MGHPTMQENDTAKLTPTDYCNKILRWILPSRKTNLISIALIATALLCYDWSLSLKWWSLLYILMFIICLAIPDYLVRQKTKK